MNRQRLIKFILIGVLILSTVASCIQPIYPQNMILQHLGTGVLLSILVVDLVKNKLGYIAFIGVGIFTLIHIIGARYIYSYVPYNEWFEAIFNIPMKHQRNHYDRFVHLAFGITFFPFLYEVFKKWNLKKLRTLLLAWFLLQFISLSYELFEWGLSMVLSPEAAEDYNGQQGDMWDTHKDMALAMGGSTLIAVLYFILPKAKK